MQADQAQERRALESFEKPRKALGADAELGIAHSGGDVGVDVRLDVRIDAQQHIYGLVGVVRGLRDVLPGRIRCRC